MQKYVSDLQLAERYGVHRVTIWRWTKKGFPKPVPLSNGCTRWRLDEVERYDAERESAAA